MLKRLTRNCILNDPMNVENFVFGFDVSNKTRNVFFDAYSHYCRSNRIQWIRSRLKVESYPVKIPTERNIDLVISTATLKYATIFQISKHWLRPDEFSKITLRDIDQDNRTILTPMSHPRAGTRKSSETQL